MKTLLQIAIENQGILLSYGPLGLMCAWFMLRGEKVAYQISDLAHRVDGLTKALLVDMIHRNDMGVTTKKYAVETIAKIDARAAKDEKK